MLYAAKVSEVPNFGKKTVTLGDREILLINIKGQIFACENECPHQGSPLQAGIVKDGHLSCPRHGYRFDLKTGKCLDFPEYILQVYPVELQGDDIMVKVD